MISPLCPFLSQTLYVQLFLSCLKNHFLHPLFASTSPLLLRRAPTGAVDLMAGLSNGPMAVKYLNNDCCRGTQISLLLFDIGSLRGWLQKSICHTKNHTGAGELPSHKRAHMVGKGQDLWRQSTVQPGVVTASPHSNMLCMDQS